MKVLVTGANGFLGSWICRVLSETHNVLALVRRDSKIGRLFGISNIEIVRGEEDDFSDIVRRFSPEIAILADWWGVENIFRNSDFQFSNVERFRRRILVLNEIERVIGIGSQAELGPRSDEIDENVNDAPTTLYGYAKVRTRELLQSNLDSSVQFTWGRVFSSYGPLDSESWLIPGTIRKIIDGQRVPLTKGEQEWSYLHALDLGRAFQSIVNDKRLVGIVNVGNSETIMICELIGIIADYMGNRNLLDFGSIPYRLDQVMKLSPTTTKLNESGWKPEVEIGEGLKSTIDWMRGNSNIALSLFNGDKVSLQLPAYPFRK